MVIITDYTVSYNEEKHIFSIECREKSICPICGHPMKYRDSVKRIMRGRNNEVRWLCIRRLLCTNESCNTLHRELPDALVPYKHFEADIIAGVLDGLISPDTAGFEDHPCEATMRGWQRWYQFNKATMEGTLRSKGYQLLGFTEKLLTASASLLEKLRSDTCDWLRIVLRFVYNSGVFLRPIWDQ